MDTTCCTCATVLSSSPTYTSSSEKPTPPTPPRRLACCNRAICTTCTTQNPRFITYCPFCQISTKPSPLPQGLRDPPPYSPTSEKPVSKPNQPSTPPPEENPPSYASLSSPSKQTPSLPSSASTPAPDVIHHIRSTDTLASVSLAYAVPASVLRAHNALFSAHLLAARKTLSIPGSHYKGGVSLSPRPEDGEEEAERKARLRRFMVATKCHRYEEAQLYLAQAGCDVDVAVVRYLEDERWERENPYSGTGKGQGKGKGVGLEGGRRPGRRSTNTGGGLTGQAG